MNDAAKVVDRDRGLDFRRRPFPGVSFERWSPYRPYGSKLWYVERLVCRAAKYRWPSAAFMNELGHRFGLAGRQAYSWYRFAMGPRLQRFGQIEGEFCLIPRQPACERCGGELILAPPIRTDDDNESDNARDILDLWQYGMPAMFFTRGWGVDRRKLYPDALLTAGSRGDDAYEEGRSPPYQVGCGGHRGVSHARSFRYRLNCTPLCKEVTDWARNEPHIRERAKLLGVAMGRRRYVDTGSPQVTALFLEFESRCAEVEQRNRSAP